MKRYSFGRKKCVLVRMIKLASLFLVFCFGCVLTQPTDDPFERGRQLLNSDDWYWIEDGLWWNTFKDLNSWPYFMYTVCVDLPIETLMDIEVYNYQLYSKNWIPELINGTKVAPTVQYLQYDFYPMPNRDVCQKWYSIPYKGGYQVYITTVDDERCLNELRYHMFEDVHKFIFPDSVPDANGTSCNRMTYIGVEDPKGFLGYVHWLVKYLYVLFYGKHFAAYKEYLRELERLQ